MAEIKGCTVLLVVAKSLLNINVLRQFESLEGLSSEGECQPRWGLLVSCSHKDLSHKTRLFLTTRVHS